MDYITICSNLNCYFINNPLDDVLQFLLCIFQKDKYIKEIRLDDNTYTINMLMKNDMCDNRVKVSILRIGDNQSVIDYQKVSGDLMTYYDQIKRIQRDYLEKIRNVNQEAGLK